MTTYTITGYWFERDGTGAVTAYGTAACAFVVPDGTGFVRYRNEGVTDLGLPILRLVFDRLALRVDGAAITDGTSNTISVAEVAFGDGSVRFVRDTLAVFDLPSGRDYLFPLGDGEPVLIDSLDGASNTIAAFEETAAPVTTGPFRPDVRIALDGLSNTVAITEDDAMSGGPAPDVLAGGRGNDTIEGAAGSDRLYGGADDDVLNGGAGRDTMQGDASDDTLRGGAGDDDLFGGVGYDVLSGGSGDDILDGGAGKDRLTGGAGADAFLFAADTGRDVITDFDAGEGDILQLSSALTGGLTDPAEILAQFAEQTASGLVLTFERGERIALRGIGPEALDDIAAAIEVF